MDQHDEDLYEEAEQDGLSQFPDNEELIITRENEQEQARSSLSNHFWHPLHYGS